MAVSKEWKTRILIKILTIYEVVLFHGNSSLSSLNPPLDSGITFEMPMLEMECKGPGRRVDFRERE